MAGNRESPVDVNADETSFNGGRCSTAVNFSKVFKVCKILELDFRNLDVGDYSKDTWDIEKVFFPTYIYYEQKSKLQREPEWYAMVRTIAELFCSDLPDHCFAKKNEARQNVTSAFRSLMTTSQLKSYSDFSLLSAAMKIFFWPGDSGVFPLNSDEAESLSLEACLNIIQFTCRPSNVKPSKIGLMIAAAIYFITAATSLGFVTNECIKKIETVVNDEFGSSITLNHEVVNLFRREIFRYLQGEIYWAKIVKIIPRLVGIKISLILRKADLESLSHLFRIGSMIKSYPDFPWSQISKTYWHETSLLKKAFKAIQPYNNYNFELIDPSLYPVFAYAAYRLAAEIEEPTLASIIALPDKDKEYSDNLVDGYLKKFLGHFMGPSNDEDCVKRLIEVIPF